MNKLNEVQELCAKCLSSCYVKRSINKLTIETLFYKNGSEEHNLLLATIDELKSKSFKGE